MSWSDAPARPAPFSRSAQLSRPVLFWGAYALVACIAAVELAILLMALNPTAGPSYREYYIDKTTTCLDREVDGSYTLGETYSFLSGGGEKPGKLKVCGWSGPAGNGTHAIGRNTRLRAVVPPFEGGLVATIELSANLIPPVTAHRVEISVNGVPAASETITSTENQVVKFAVPEAALARSRTRLDFDFTFPDAYQTRPLAADTTLRGMRLRSFRLDAASANAGQVNDGQTPSGPAPPD